jgi:3-hydroxyisobutyrate dehydrogenase-like beta-hydroxyacid dehydrogenase
MTEEIHIGFIGLGTMGSRMAQRLLKAGYPLVVYNRARSKAEALAAQGAMIADTPRAVAAMCDYVMTSLVDDAAIEAVFYGPDGVLAGARSGVTCIDLSTIAPSTSRRLAEAAAEHGVSMIDAPVSGSTSQAEAGSLIIFIGGDEATYQRSQFLLELLGRSFYMGPSGKGSTMKLVANTLLGTGMQALAEAITLGEKTGLERDRLLDVLGQTAVIAPSQKAKLDNVRRSEYPTAFALRLMYKDFRLILREATDFAVSMPATAVAQQLCAAEYARRREEDYSAVVALMENLAAVPCNNRQRTPATQRGRLQSRPLSGFALLLREFERRMDGGLHCPGR